MGRVSNPNLAQKPILWRFLGLCLPGGLDIKVPSHGPVTAKLEESDTQNLETFISSLSSGHICD